MAEIDLKSLIQDYSKEAFDDMKDKLQDGEYVPGRVYTQQFPDDISDVIENLMFLQEQKELVFRVRKDADDYHLTFEVLSRK